MCRTRTTQLWQYRIGQFDETSIFHQSPSLWNISSPCIVLLLSDSTYACVFDTFRLTPALYAVLTTRSCHFFVVLSHMLQIHILPDDVYWFYNAHHYWVLIRLRGWMLINCSISNLQARSSRMNDVLSSNKKNILSHRLWYNIFQYTTV